MNRIFTSILLLLIIATSCKPKRSTIQVQNMLSKAIINNVEWGGLPLTSKLLPGQASNKISIYEEDSYYDIELPESHPLKFYMELNGEKVYLETRESYNLGKGSDLVVTITDSTKVFNPLLESQK